VSLPAAEQDHGSYFLPCPKKIPDSECLASIEYYTTTTVAKYLGLTYREFYNLPTKDPDKLRMIFVKM
jgi:hypothetical protein